MLELALREALSLGHNYIGTETSCSYWCGENEGVAARILLDFDADAEKICNGDPHALGPGDPTIEGGRNGERTGTPADGRRGVAE